VVRFKVGPCSLFVNLPVLCRCASAALRRVIRDLSLLAAAATIISMLAGAG
jgi:hypothetical protein